MIGPLSTFFTLIVLSTSPLTTLTGVARNSMAAVPLTGGFMRAFISSADTGAGVVLVAGLASCLGAVLAAWAKTGPESARQKSAADGNARRLIEVLPDDLGSWNR